MNKTEAVEVLQDYLNEIRGFIAFEVGSALDLAIEALSKRPKGEWIPVSERLPRTGDDILVTFSDGEVDIIWSARPQAWVKYEEANNLIFPVAWMPLPKPYKGGDDE